jgi:hypothetical protein
LPPGRATLRRRVVDTGPPLEEAVEAAREAVRLAGSLRSPRLQGQALVVLAWALWSMDEVREAKTAASAPSSRWRR